jgi:hypothetical protein
MCVLLPFFLGPGGQFGDAAFRKRYGKPKDLHTEWINGVATKDDLRVAT